MWLTKVHHISLLKPLDVNVYINSNTIFFGIHHIPLNAKMCLWTLWNTTNYSHSSSPWHKIGQDGETRVCQFSQSEQIGWIKAIRYTKWRSHSILLDGLTTLFQTYLKRISWWGQAIRPIPTGSQFFCLSWTHDRAPGKIELLSACLSFQMMW